MRPRLKHLIGPDVNLLLDASQSQNRDMAFETLVGCLLAEFSTDITFSEPDITMHWNGLKWGFACKILYTTNISSQIDSIVEGSKQIEKSDCDYGLVVVHLANQVCHNKLLRYYGEMLLNFKDASIPSRILADETTRLIRNIENKTILKRLTQNFGGNPRNRTRGILFFGQSVTAIRKVLVPLCITNFYRFRNLIWLEDRLSSLINNAAQTINIHVEKAL